MAWSRREMDGTARQSRTPGHASGHEPSAEFRLRLRCSKTDGEDHDPALCALRPLLVRPAAGGLDRGPVPGLPRARGARGLEGGGRVQGLGDLGRQHDPASRHSGASGGRAAGDVRDPGRGGARPSEPRPGRRGDALQAPALRRSNDRYPVGRRNRRAPCRAQGDDERTVPEGPGGQDPPGAAGAGSNRAARAAVSVTATTW